MRNFKCLYIFCLTLFSLTAFSQKVNPISITYGVSKTNYKAGDTVTFIINVKIQDGWYMYSSDFPADGPMKFECHIDKSNDFKIIDTIRPYKPYSHYDEVWEGEVKIFEKTAQFRLPVIVNKAGAIAFKGSCEGQVCSDLCVPFKEVINADLSKLAFSDFIAADPSVYKHYDTEGTHK